MCSLATLQATLKGAGRESKRGGDKCTRRHVAAHATKLTWPPHAVTPSHRPCHHCAGPPLAPTKQSLRSPHTCKGETRMQLRAMDCTSFASPTLATAACPALAPLVDAHAGCTTPSLLPCSPHISHSMLLLWAV
jgi:hypothetical protein